MIYASSFVYHACVLLMYVIIDVTEPAFHVSGLLQHSSHVSTTCFIEAVHVCN